MCLNLFDYFFFIISSLLYFKNRYLLLDSKFNLVGNLARSIENCIKKTTENAEMLAQFMPLVLYIDIFLVSTFVLSLIIIYLAF